MAASLPSDIHPTHPESSRSDELTTITRKKPNITNEEPSETAATIESGQTKSNRDSIPKSQESSENSNLTLERQGYGCDSATATVVAKEVMIHPETSCVEEDVCEGCGQSRLERKRLLKLEKEVQRVEESLREKEEIIARLWEENARKTAELLEIQLQKVHLGTGL